MRSLSVLAFAAALLGFSIGASQPAAAGWDDSHGYGTIYIHHHVYYPGRFRHVYHIHKPGPRHVHVGPRRRIHHYSAEGSSYWPRAYYRDARWGWYGHW